MFDLIFTAIFILAAVLVLAATMRDWRATQRFGCVLPVGACVLAILCFIFDPWLMGVPWLAGIVWLLISVGLRLIVRGRSRQST